MHIVYEVLNKTVEAIFKKIEKIEKKNCSTVYRAKL